MNVSKTVRLVALTAVAALAAACGESMTAPTATETNGTMRPPFDVALTGGPSFSLESTDGSTTLTVDPTVTRFYQIGPHWVYIPAGAVCDLSSSYGPTEWDKDCVSATGTITIPVSYGMLNGHPLIEFGTDMRFRPSNSPFKWVVLYMRDAVTDVSKYSVLYRGHDGVWVNEGKSDPQLRALRLSGAYVVRRVKHFSGYNVSLGDGGDEQPCTAEYQSAGLCTTSTTTAQ